LLLIFPLPYYLVLTLPRYRDPIAPILYALTAYWVSVRYPGVVAERSKE
jgi:hypothetical protein